MLAQPKTRPRETSPRISAKIETSKTSCGLQRFVGKVPKGQHEPTEVIRKC
jgi:hypothetical protein